MYVAKVDTMAELIKVLDRLKEEARTSRITLQSGGGSSMASLIEQAHVYAEDGRERESDSFRDLAYQIGDELRDIETGLHEMRRIALAAGLAAREAQARHTVRSGAAARIQG